MTEKELALNLYSTGLSLRAVAKELGFKDHKRVRLLLKGYTRGKKFRPFVLWRGTKYVQNKKGYWRCESRALGRTYLHRDVWEFHNGPLPEGYDVHHIDEDKSNNAIENLEARNKHDHQRHHMHRRTHESERCDQQSQNEGESRDGSAEEARGTEAPQAPGLHSDSGEHLESPEKVAP